MRTAPALVTTLILLALPGAAAASTYQRGVLSYSASGSWTSSTNVTETCNVASGDDATDPRTFTYPVVERGTFTTGRGRAGYRGTVGRAPLFNGLGDRAARLRVTVTRTAARPVQCVPAPSEDCGTRTVRGVARGSFETPRSSRSRIDLRLDFLDRSSAGKLTDPFKTCGADATDILLNRISGATASPNLQSSALRFPKAKSFWHYKGLKLSGSARTPGITFAMKLRTSRRTLSSRRR